jgi:hypothetical protein
VTDERIAAGIAALTGEIDQVPSTVSAIKVAGRRAYDLARAGESVELAARRVTVDRFDIVRRRDTAEGRIDLDVVVDCSSGTYIRALARDLGAALGVGGHLTALRRTRIGAFEVARRRLRDRCGRAAAVAGAGRGIRARCPPRHCGRSARPPPRQASGRRGTAAGGGDVTDAGGDRSRRPARRDRRATRCRHQERDEHGGGRMIEWFAIVQVAVAVVAGLVAIILGLAGRRPSDLTVGAMALILLLLLAQVVIAIVAPRRQPAGGSALEFWVYLVSAVLIPRHPSSGRSSNAAAGAP